MPILNNLVCQFKISDINSGWFEGELIIQSYGVHLVDSKILGNDAPKFLLQSLNKLSKCDVCDAWIHWHDDPNAIVCCLKKKGNNVLISIYDTPLLASELPMQGTALPVMQRGEIILNGEVPFMILAKSILNEFAKYKEEPFLKLYENEWSPFPMDEFNQLEEFCLAKIKA